MTIAACKKEREEQGPIALPEPTADEKLASTWWRLYSYELHYNSNGAAIEKEYIDSLEKCITDNMYLFHKNGAIEIMEGPKKCSPGHQDFRSAGHWELLDGHVLKTTIDGIINRDSILIVTTGGSLHLKRPGDTTILLKYRNGIQY